MAETTDTVIEQALLDFRVVFQAMMQEGMATFIQRADLSMAQIKTLFIIIEGERPAVGDIGEALGVSLPTASHLVDKLVEAGLALRVRDEGDRRRVLIEASPEGHQLVTMVSERGKTRMRALLHRLSPEHLDGFSAGLAALAAITRQEHSRESPFNGC